MHYSTARVSICVNRLTRFFLFFGLLSGFNLPARCEDEQDQILKLAKKSDKELKELVNAGNEQASLALIDRVFFRTVSTSAHAQRDISMAKLLTDKIEKLEFHTRGRWPNKISAINACWEAGNPVIPTIDKLPETTGKVDCRKSTSFAQHARCLWTAPNGKLSPPKAVETYVNGWGVEQNLKLAMALLCTDATNLPDDVLRLSRYSAKAGQSGEFLVDSCEDEPSLEGKLAELCDDERRPRILFLKELRLTKETTDWRQPEISSAIALYPLVEKFATQDFNQPDAADDYSGIYVDGMIRRYFHELIAKLPKTLEKIPTVTEEVDTDKLLNSTYKKLLSTYSNGSLNTERVKMAERAWIVVRDQWIKVVKARYSGKFSEKELARWAIVKLTKMRIEDFEETFTHF